MTKIGKLPGITPAEATTLASNGVGTIEELWQRIEASPDDALDTLETATHIYWARLAKLASAQAVKEAKATQGHWLLRNLMGLGVILGMPLLALALLGLFRSQPPPVGWSGTVQPQVVVAAGAGIQPLQPIRDTDLEIRPTGNADAALVSPTTIVGRVAVRKLAAGTVIRESDLIPVGTPAPQRLVLVLPAGTVGVNTPANATVTVLFAPRDRSEKAPQPVFARGAVIVSVNPVAGSASESPTESVVIQLSSSDLAKVIPLLGVSDVFVLP